MYFSQQFKLQDIEILHKNLEFNTSPLVYDRKAIKKKSKAHEVSNCMTLWKLDMNNGSN